jgi:hypothetical protein
LRHGQFGMGKGVIDQECGQGHEVCRPLGYLCNQSFMTVADYRVDAGQRRDLLGRPLSVATGDKDARGGVFAVHSAHEGTGGAIRLRGHTAGVGDDHIGPAGAQSRGQPAMAQLGAYDFAIRPAGSTSEVLNVVFCHVASLIKNGCPLKETLFQVGSDQATDSPRRPTAFVIWSFFP